MQTQNIIVIDDDEDIGELIVAAAEEVGSPCISTQTAAGFLEALTPETTLVFLDLIMPQLDGIELLRLISEQPCKPKIVLMSGIGKRVIETAHRLAESLGLTVVAELQKPFRLSEVEDILGLQSSAARIACCGTRMSIDFSEAEVRRAIERQEFVLHYQPQVRLADNRILGVEALVRWQHPKLGLVFPDNFIHLVQKFGLIDDLSWIVATVGLTQQAAFSAALGYGIALSINIAANSLRELTFPDRLMTVVEKCGISPEMVTIEITEAGLIQELSSALDVLTRLRMKGIRLCIDDFGTGYSMMQQLRLVPANELKIDKSFVQGVHSGTSDRVMVLKTIEIAHDLDMTVVGEGVETGDQLGFLREHGCDVVQGFLFSRPLPANALNMWFSAWPGRAREFA